MSVFIRLAEPADAPKLPDIEGSAGQVFVQIPGLEWIADDHVMSAEQHLPAITAQTAWVASQDEGIVAFLSAEHVGDALHIHQISVHADAMGQGIGRRLIDAAIAAARVRGLSAVTLTTFRDVPWNEPYYQRLGFETLAARQLDQRLASVLEAEIEAGLPGDRRCAMRLNLALGHLPV
jgi:GNAT superfamily N-acetyltransferase